MVIAADSIPHKSNRQGPKTPLINPEQRPCAVCGTMFWHESFHRRRLSQQHRQRKTCGVGCRYILAMRNNPPGWRERFYGKTGT